MYDFGFSTYSYIFWTSRQFTNHYVFAFWIIAWEIFASLAFTVNRGYPIRLGHEAYLTEGKWLTQHKLRA